MNHLQINNLEFAKNNQALSGNLEVSDTPRLNAAIIPSDKEIANICYKLVGSMKAMNTPALDLFVEAHLPTQCQRCLGEMTLHLALNFTYLIGEINLDDDEDDAVDWLEASKEMDLAELIEDELLLAMPIAPMHETECHAEKMQSGETTNPFAVLKGRFK